MDIVESLYQEIVDLDNYLLNNREISLRITADSNLRKSLLLASASFFEERIIELIVKFARKASNDEKLVFFIQKKALSRQYHTLFSWDQSNCTSFLILFGEEYKRIFSDMVTNDEELDKSVKNFLEIGNERNRMVHQNFGQYSLEKTSKEIIELHKSAKNFLNKLEESLFINTETVR
jgi:hypothetical protein